VSTAGIPEGWGRGPGHVDAGDALLLEVLLDGLGLLEDGGEVRVGLQPLEPLAARLRHRPGGGEGAVSGHKTRWNGSDTSSVRRMDIGNSVMR